MESPPAIRDRGFPEEYHTKGGLTRPVPPGERVLHYIVVRSAAKAHLGGPRVHYWILLKR